MIKVIVNSIVIGIVNPMPLFLLLFFAILSSHFFPKRFCSCLVVFRFTAYLFYHCQSRSCVTPTTFAWVSGPCSNCHQAWSYLFKDTVCTAPQCQVATSLHPFDSSSKGRSLPVGLFSSAVEWMLLFCSNYTNSSYLH